MLFVNITFSQNFVMTWRKCYGGSNTDIVRSLINYKDGYLFFGYSNSTDENVTNNNCNGAAWMVNIDKKGEIIFEKPYCGFDGASGKKIISIDSGFYLTGSTGPNNYGGTNGYWFARTDTNFNILWQDVLGGSYVEDPRGACIAHDGGVIQYGLTGSPDGDIEEYYGTFDNWLVKMNPDGSRDWIKTLGNVGAEEGSCLIPTSDGNYLYACVGENFLPGNTYCEGHDNRLSEGWIFKLNEDGEVLWHQCYGGSDIELFRGILELDDGYIILGSSHSNDLDLPGNYGLSDVWILKIDKDGDLLWSKNYGGSKWDYFYRIFKNENNTFTIFCLTNSTDYNVQGNNSGTVSDWVVWMIIIDENGNLLYQKPFSELSFLRGDNDFVKVSDYKYVAAVTRYSLDNCYYTGGDNPNKDIYIFEIQDMDEFIPSQPIGSDQICLGNTTESYYSTQLVTDTMETQWLLIPEEAGTLTQLHDSLLIQWNQNFTDTAFLQVRAVNEYGESSYSEAKEIIVYPPLALSNINGPDSLCTSSSQQSIFTTQIEENIHLINWYLEPETAGVLNNQQDTAIISWNLSYEGLVSLKTAIVNPCDEEEYSSPKEISIKTCTGLEEQKAKELKIYPNPAKTQITFELPDLSKESLLQIKDVFGKTIAQLRLNKNQSNIIWNCSNVSKGVYFFQTQINGEVYRGKIIVN